MTSRGVVKWFMNCWKVIDSGRVYWYGEVVDHNSSVMMNVIASLRPWIRFSFDWSLTIKTCKFSTRFRKRTHISRKHENETSTIYEENSLIKLCSYRYCSTSITAKQFARSESNERVKEIARDRVAFDIETPLN